jgi:Tol biopolymer transport system component
VPHDARGQQPIAPPHVFLVDADGSDERLLTETRARFPSWSSNGKIAFDNGGGANSDIFVANADGPSVRQDARSADLRAKTQFAHP